MASKESRFSFNEISSYLQTGSYSEGFNRADKQALRKRSKYFVMKDSRLYYVGGPARAEDTQRLVVEDIEMRRSIIADAHNSSPVHLGLNRTNNMVACEYYWPGLFKDVRDHVGNCDKCRRKKRLQKADAKLTPCEAEEEGEEDGSTDLDTVVDAPVESRKAAFSKADAELTPCEAEEEGEEDGSTDLDTVVDAPVESRKAAFSKADANSIAVKRSEGDEAEMGEENPGPEGAEGEGKICNTMLHPSTRPVTFRGVALLIRRDFGKMERIRDAWAGDGETGAPHPEACAHELYRCHNLHEVKRILRQADQEWMEAFLECGGLVAIFEALSALGRASVSTLADVMPQLQCIECLKAVMTSDYGLEYMVSSRCEKYIEKLVLELDTANVLVKMQLFLLLSALCKHSEEGLQSTLQALDHYKRVKCQRHRYSVLVHELETAGDFPEYQASVLAFINYVVSSCEQLDDRVKIRSELSALLLHDILAILRFSDNECLSEQVRHFEERQMDDEQEIEVPGGVDITNHEHVFRAVFEKVFRTPQSSSFLHILQKMFLIERDTSQGDIIWSTLERFMDSALAVSGPQQAERVHATGLQKLKKALEEEEARRMESGRAEVVSEQQEPATKEREEETTAPSNQLGQDGVEATDGPSTTAPAPASASAPPPPPPPPPGMGKRIAKRVASLISIFDKARQYTPKKRMKKVNWEKVPVCDALSTCTLWHGASVPEVKLRIHLNEELVEALFCQKGQAKGDNRKGDDKPKKAHLPNVKKALNVNIILDSLKCSNNEVIGRIRTGAIKSFTLNQITILTDQMPDENDANFLMQYECEESVLGKTEQFLLKLIHLEGYPLRLQAMEIRLSFEDIVEEYMPSLEVVKSALDELMSCASLQELFYTLLLIGNIINAGTRLGEAYGFKLSSLQRLSATLANVSRPNVNILHYLVTICENDSPRLLQFPSELPHLDGASRISVDAVTQEIAEWQEKVVELKEQLAMDELPPDLKGQLQAFIPSAEEKLSQLSAGLESVKEKSEEAAKYFCDNRQDFLEVVFQEVTQFKNELQKSIKETLKEKPIQLHWRKLDGDEQTPAVTESSEPALGSLTKEQLDHLQKRRETIILVTSPELDFTNHKNLKQTFPETIPEAGMEGETLPKSRLSLAVEGDVMTQQPTLASGPTTPTTPTTPLTPGRLLPSPKYHRTISSATPGSPTRPLFKRSSVSVIEYAGRKASVAYLRRASAAPQLVFQGRLDNIAKVLHKMAKAIEKDVNIQVEVTHDLEI